MPRFVFVGMLTILLVSSALALGASGTGSTPTSAHVSAITIDTTAVLAPGGLGVTISGTVRCDVGETFGVNATVVQFRRARQEAFGLTGGACTGSVQQWQIVATGGPLQPGIASVIANGGASDEFCCQTTFASVKIRRH